MSIILSDYFKEDGDYSFKDLPLFNLIVKQIMIEEGVPVKMTRKQFYDWARQRTQWTDNESLNPHNPDVADSAIVEVISWQDFVDLIFRLTEGEIEIIEKDKSVDS